MVDILSIHIPKTAGTSFRRALEQVLPAGAVLGDYHDWLDDPRNTFHTDPNRWQEQARAFTRTIGPEVRVIHGHFSAIKYRDAFPTARCIAWLRHPVARLVSHYHFWKTFPLEAAPGHPLLPPLHDGRMGLLDLAEVPVLRDLAQRHYLRGLAVTDLAFIGLQEHYAADLAEMGRAMGWPTLPVLTENRRPGLDHARAVFRDRGLVRRIEALNPGDMHLYETALAQRARRVRGRWWRALRSMGPSFRAARPLSSPA